jgi:hypothetical protein
MSMPTRINRLILDGDFDTAAVLFDRAAGVKWVELSTAMGRSAPAPYVRKRVEWVQERF